jgi:hexosaminidase
MKKIKLMAITLLILLNIGTAQNVNMIPCPSHMEVSGGEFTISPSTIIVAPGQLNEIAGIFSEKLKEVVGFKPVISPAGAPDGNILLSSGSSKTGEESYELIISPAGAEIRSGSATGIFYGLQTIIQLLITSGNNKLPCVEIQDAPRFAWRGVMLDVSRTFMPVNLLKRYIDLFALYKLNVLHLHLTDDQGWRIEIKQYPLLTEVGSKFDAKYNCMGGYYSQDDIRDLVRYAQLRNMTIVPEIELPGHACAAIASYPWLSCSGKRTEIHTFFEGPSVHKEILCAGKPEVYRFIFNVLDEITELFPSEYIHIGGDEAPKDEWKKCRLCQETMKGNGLDNEEELQSYFVKRIGEYLRSKHRTLIGWDEIYDGGKLKGDEVLMFWRGWKADSIETAAARGFKIVSCPTTCCYFDYDYDKTNTRKVFDYEPVPENINPGISANYLGVQANFWSHIDRSEYNIDKQLFPRLMGLAETAWSMPGKCTWESFRITAEKNTEYLKNKQINVYDDQSLRH